MTSRNFHLHTSNRAEALAGKWIDLVEESPLPGVFQKEAVMAQNLGTARWLSFQVAERTGIAFNIDFPFPRKVFESIAQAIEPAFAEKASFSVPMATWALQSLLVDLPKRPAYRLLNDYCEGSSSVKRFRLARRLASLYDAYLVYRPEQILSWEKEAPRTWQGMLWRELLKILYDDKAPLHLPRIWDMARKGAMPEPSADEAAPSRLSVFGISSLAPLYLDLLYAYAQAFPVHIFLLQPTDLYWADLQTESQARRAALRKASKDGADPPPTIPAYDAGNPLLPLLGKQGQAFLDMLIDKDPMHDDSAFEQPEGESLLAALQKDMLSLDNRGISAASRLPDPDGTLQFHSCHNKRRECEVLRDTLLDCFEKNPSLEPGAIMVMAPDIEEYASLIESTFSSGADERLHLPYSIADQSSLSRSLAIRAALDTLMLPLQRMTSQEMMDLLASPPVSVKFGFSEQELATLRIWIRDNGITWGWDTSHRKARNAFATDQATWSELARILGSGLALSGESDRLHNGILPCPDLEGDLAALAGRFLRALELIKELVAASAQEKPLVDWIDFFREILPQIIAFDSEENDQSANFLEAMEESLQVPKSLQGEPVSYASAAEALKGALQSQTPRSGYLNGRITFCSLKPMRSIPAKVIALLGMNLDSFPRKASASSLDLMRQNPRRGDRNPRDEDKQIFLETLLSARERLSISYIGQSDKGDAQIPPSVVVSPLLDYLRANYKRSSQGEEAMERLHFLHKRQCFDPSYLQQGHLFTYSKNAAETAIALANSNLAISENSPKLPNLEYDNSEAIDIQDFQAFFRHPLKRFLATHCGLRIPELEEQAETEDALQSSGLDRYLRNAYAINQASAVTAPELAAYFKARKWVSHGHFGDFESAESIAEAASINHVLEPFGVSGHRYAVPFHLPLESFTIVGSLLASGDGWLLDAAPNDFAQRPKRLLQVWIEHLIATCVARNDSFAYKGNLLAGLRKGEPLVASLASLDAEQAQGHLNELCKAFASAMQRPMLLMPELGSFLAAEKLKVTRKDRAFDLEKALALAESKFLAPARASFSKATNSLSKDPYLRILFGENPSLDAETGTLLLQIWEPILRSLQEHEEVTA